LLFITELCLSSKLSEVPVCSDLVSDVEEWPGSASGVLNVPLSNPNNNITNITLIITTKLSLQNAQFWDFDFDDNANGQLSLHPKAWFTEKLFQKSIPVRFLFSFDNNTETSPNIMKVFLNQQLVCNQQNHAISTENVSLDDSTLCGEEACEATNVPCSGRDEVTDNPLCGDIEGLIVRVNYTEVRNGKMANCSDCSFLYKDGIVYLSQPGDKISFYSDYNNKESVSILKYNDKLVKTVLPFENNTLKPTFENKTETILGYECNYARFISFSNTIEVWFTEETKIQGSLYRSFVPNDKALILKIVWNGDQVLTANSIQQVKNNSLVLDFPAERAELVTKAVFEELKIKSRYERISVFQNQTINYNTSIKVPTGKLMEPNTTFEFSHGSVVLKRILLPESIRKSASIHVELSCWSDGDSYDRVGSVFILKTASENNVTYLEAFKNGIDVLPITTDVDENEYQGIVSEDGFDTEIEIMRFVTTFGVGHYNEKRKINNYNWVDKALYNQDVTSLIPNDEKDLFIGVFIGNYDKNGHKINLDINVYPEDEDEKEEKISRRYMQPLFSTAQIMETSGQNYGKLFRNDSLNVTFNIPHNVENLTLLYTTTGHGGWTHGDEFNQRINEIFLDDVSLFKIVPWRSDCGTHRLANPASGNFHNGQSSSDFSRSNWCPGTITPPFVIPLELAAPGRHRLEVVIDQGASEGSYFNHWRISGVIVGDWIEDFPPPTK